MTTPSLSSEYHVWVLRLWRENADSPWRITLESVATHEREGFTDLNRLIAYLQDIYSQAGAVSRDSISTDHVSDPNNNEGY